MSDRKLYEAGVTTHSPPDYDGLLGNDAIDAKLDKQFLGRAVEVDEDDELPWCVVLGED